MIHTYQQWLDESEKMEAGAAAPAETPDTAMPEMPTEETPAMDATGEMPIDSAESEIEQYRTLDTARREAIKAFKSKQEEFLQIPDETRKNPTEEADKTKIETLKTELIELNKTMKAAIREWDSFNSMALGLSDDEDLDEEP
jgi:hypothetical protein